MAQGSPKLKRKCDRMDIEAERRHEKVQKAEKSGKNWILTGIVS